MADIKDNTEDQDKAIGEQNEANRLSNEEAKAGPVDRNKGRGVTGSDEKNPNPNDIHSDDPMVAGLANGERQARGEGDKGGVVT